MDLIDNLAAIASKIPRLKQEGLIKTEEGTKNALVMPFINALGYNVFDPTEVTPELIADVGTKKGEKVDYAILKDRRPIILMECKSFGTNLSNAHASQLYRYFTTTSARFGILTDGVIYRFYTDLVSPNIMDEDPFFIFDLRDIKEQHVEELKKFTKSAYDETRIVSSASNLKYKNLIKQYFTAQVTQPSEPFIRHIIQQLQDAKAYSGRATQSAIDEFAPIIRDSLRMFISDQVEARLKSALERDTTEAEEPTKPDSALSPELSTEETQAIVTTQEEIEAFIIVKSILRDAVDPKRVSMRDQQSYCGILLDDNNRRPICRLRFNGNKKFIGIMNDQRQEEKYPVETLDDIFKYGDKLKTAVAFYEHREVN